MGDDVTKKPASKYQERLSRRTADKLSSKEKLSRDIFVNAVLRGVTPPEAAIMAGFSAKSATVRASTLWAEPYVQKRYEKLRKQVDTEALITRADIELRLWAESGNYLPGSGSAMARVSAMKTLADMRGYIGGKRDASEDKSTEKPTNVMLIPTSENREEWEAMSKKMQSDLQAAVEEDINDNDVK